MSELHNRRVFVAGHRGMVGSAICRALERQGNNTVITQSRDELDLMDQGAVLSFFKNTKIDSVFSGRSEGWRNSGEQHLSG